MTNAASIENHPRHASEGWHPCLVRRTVTLRGAATPAKPGSGAGGAILSPRP